MHAVQVLHFSAGAGAFDMLSLRCVGCACCCPAGKPAGVLYTSAHDLLRKLQRQQQERGWRCAAGRAAAAGYAEGADVSKGMCAAGASEGVGVAGAEGLSNPGPRRFLTSAERTRQQLAAQCAKTYKEWVLHKKQQQEREKHLVKVGTRYSDHYMVC